MLNCPSFTPAFACLGGGAIGFSVMARFAYLDLEAALITRSQIYSQHVTSQSVVSVRTFDSQWHFYPRPLSDFGSRSLKLVFVAVQTYNLESALARLARSLAPGTVVVSLCNGKCDDILRRFQESHPHLHVRLGIVFYNSTAHGTDYQCSEGRLVWGALSQEDSFTTCEESLCRLQHKNSQLSIEGEEGPFQITRQIIELYQKKWIFNTTVNSVSAAFEIHNVQDILRKHKEEFDRTFHEAFQLATTMWGELSFTYDATKKLAGRTLIQLGDAEVSMHRHLREGKQTESAFLAGCAAAYPGPEFSWLKHLHQKITSQEFQANLPVS